MSKKGKRNRTNPSAKGMPQAGQKTDPVKGPSTQTGSSHPAKAAQAQENMAKESPSPSGLAIGGSAREKRGAQGDTAKDLFSKDRPGTEDAFNARAATAAPHGRTASSSAKKKGRMTRTDAEPFWNGRSILLSLFTLMIIIIPYFKGLFFDADMINADLFFTGLALLTLILLWKRSEDLFKTPVPYLVLAILLIYFLSALQGIVPNLAYDEAFRWVTYLISFTALLLLIGGKRRGLLLHGLFLSMLWVSLYGLLAHFGLVTFQDAMLGNRIASVLQYPNTYAAVVAALMIGILFAAATKAGRTEEEHEGEGRKARLAVAVPYLYLLFLPALLIAFVYSQSRAAWLLFPLVWFAGLFFLSLKQQLHYAITTLLVAAGSLPLMPFYDKAAQAKDGRFLLLLLGIGLLYAAISYGIALLLRRWGYEPKKALSRFLLPGLFLLAGVVALTLIQTPAVVKMMPEAIQSRLADINLTTRSVTERGTFYEDSMTLFKDHWLIGAGGNAWKGLFLKYETLPYYSSQTHSFAMKVLVDTGIAGSLLFLAFFGLILFILFRAYRKEGFSFAILNRTGLPLLMGGMLFLHSLIDFDMSYGYYVLLFIAFLALLCADGREYGGEVRIPYLDQYKQRGLLPWLKGGFLLFMAIPYLFIILFAYAQSIPVNNLTAQEARANADRKVALKPASVDYRLMRMDILAQIGKQAGDAKIMAEAFAEGERVLSIDRYNPQTALKVATLFGKYGQGLKALEITDTALKNGNWFLSAYEQYISFASQIALAQRQEGKKAEAEGLLKRVDALLQELERKRALLDKQIESQRYPEFSYTESIRRYGGEALVLLGQYERAAALLDPLKGSADPQTKGEAFLWLSIAKEKLGAAGEVTPLLEEAKKIDPALEGKRAQIMPLLMP